MSDRHAFFYSCSILLLVTAPVTPLESAERTELKENESLPGLLVRRALQAEVAGDAVRRNRLLADARRLAPDHAPARWHAGFVRVGDQWLEVEAAEEQVAADGHVTEYRLLRDRLAGSVEGQVTLARWCRRRHFDELEKLHWRQVLELNPSHAEARKRLAVREFAGLLLTQEQIQIYRDLAGRREASLAKWKPRVQRWQRTLERGDAHQRVEAFRELQSVRDPSAIPVFEKYLSPRSREAGVAVVKTIAGMKGQEATDSLVRHAVLSDFPRVRSAAASELQSRSWFGYIPGLLGNLQAPLELSYYVNTLADGANYGFTVEREGPRAYYSWSHGHRSFREHVISHVHDGELVGISTLNLPDPATATRGAAEIGVLRRAVDEENSRTESLNQCIYDVLETATGQRFERTPQAWWRWWLQYNELHVERDPAAHQRQTASVSFPKVRSQVSSSTYVPQEVPQSSRGSLPRYVPRTGRPWSRPATTSCFLPGTPVATNAGPLPIEKVRAGDYVLSQDPDTGEVDYRPVIGTTVRPPSPTLRIRVGREAIVATRGHPLWIVGEGWVMAKELCVGENLHGVRGPVSIDSIEPGPDAQAYNLVVAGFHTFFVGQQRILAHDNIARRPTTATVPGLTAD